METTIILSESTAREITVKIPCFRKHKHSVYKVYSPKKAIKVGYFPEIQANEILSVDISLAFTEGSEDCSEDYYTDQFIKVMNELRLC